MYNEYLDAKRSINFQAFLAFQNFLLEIYSYVRLTNQNKNFLILVNSEIYVIMYNNYKYDKLIRRKENNIINLKKVIKWDLLNIIYEEKKTFLPTVM